MMGIETQFRNSIQSALEEVWTMCRRILPGVMVLLTVLALWGALASGNADEFPRTEIVTSPAGTRIDVIGRPSNKTPGSEKNRHPVRKPGTNGVGILTSESSPPLEISVAIRLK